MPATCFRANGDSGMGNGGGAAGSVGLPMKHGRRAVAAWAITGDWGGQAVRQGWQGWQGWQGCHCDAIIYMTVILMILTLYDSHI